jgi:hypothetical protein
VPGEKTPTQPFPTKPAAFDRQGVSIDDLIDFTPELRAEAIKIADQYKLGPLFNPPIVAGTGGKKGALVVPSAIGGANWRGGAADPESGTFEQLSSCLSRFSRAGVKLLGIDPVEAMRRLGVSLRPLNAIHGQRPAVSRGCNQRRRA